MANLLAKIPLLSDLPAEELDQLVNTLKVAELQPRALWAPFMPP